MTDEIETLAEAVKAGDRRALARAITLVESARTDHRGKADRLLERLADPERQALRIGLSGTPGVGKSTFIEAFGCMLTGRPCKYMFDREEEMQVGAPRGAERWYITDGVMNDVATIPRCTWLVRMPARCRASKTRASITIWSSHW